MSSAQEEFKDGSIRQMLSIAFPMLVSNACETVLIFTDRLFVSKIDPAHLNASLTGGMFVFMSMTFFIGLIGYVTALAAQYFGSGRKNKCSLALFQALILSFAAYPLLLLSRPLAHAVFRGMNLGPEQIAPQILYFDTLMYICIFSLIRHALSSFFAGIGQTRIVMASSFIMMIINVGLNYVLVFGKFGFPALGIQGAAYGSIIAGAAAALVLSAGYLRRSIRHEFAVRQSLRFDKEIMGKLLRFGYPAGLEFFLNMLAFTMMILIFQSVSPAVATAITIMINWDIVSYVPLMGVEIGVMSLVGRFMGMGKPAVAHRSAMSGILFGLLYSVFVFILFLGFPGLLVAMFAPLHNSAIFLEATPIAVNMIRLACFYVLAQSVMIALAGALRGAGDTLWAMIITVGMHWTLLPVLYVVLHVFGLPAETAWISLIIVFFIFVALIVRRYSKGRWQQIQLVS